MTEKTIWSDNGRVYLLDQTLLPGEKKVLEITSVEQMWEAIKALRVRGAPAIGIAAAYGVYIALKSAAPDEDVVTLVPSACDYLATARPTAVNLFWALERVFEEFDNSQVTDRAAAEALLLDIANRIREGDEASCKAIGRFGADLLSDRDSVLTHCNAGGLATATYGTALAPIYFAVQEQGKNIEVFADETRPLLQGSRLTAWELMQANIPVTLICDNMAGTVMRSGKVNAVIVGADRIAANGDFANKIGTYGVAVLAREHGIPFYVAAPLSTFDRKLSSGDQIPIEERDSAEVTSVWGMPTAPEGVRVFNPAFDVTPASYVAAFITECGILRPPFDQAIANAFARS